MNWKIILMLCIAGLLVSGGIAASNEGKGNARTQSVSIEAFRGQAVTDLIINVSPDIQAVKKIQVKAYYTNGTIKFTRNFDNAVSSGGIILLQFDDLMRGERADVRVQGDTGSGVDASTTVKLRPDLAVSVNTVSSVAVGENLPVSVTITENNGDLGSDAVLSLMDGDSVLNSTTVSVNAGSVASAVLSTSFAVRGEHNLSVRIVNPTPADYDGTNNVQYFVVNSVAPDIAITGINAPPAVNAGEMFEVSATVSELYNETGATVTLALFEGINILDTRTIDMTAGGHVTISLNGTLYGAGLHDIQVRIIGTIPADSNPSNNGQSFAIQVQEASMLLESMYYSTKYSYKNTTLNTSHYVISEGYEDKSEVLETRENDALSFTASSSRILGLPIDRLYISISNEAGETVVYQETGLGSEGSGTFVKYYPDNNAVLTVQISENGTTVSLESKSNSTVKRSKGYIYWWFKPSQEWDVTTTSGSGRLIRAKERVQVRVELEDDSRLLGGTALTNLTGNSYPWSWIDTSDGWFGQQRTVWTYSGKSSGDTGT